MAWHIEWRGMRQGRPIETVLLGSETAESVLKGMTALALRLSKLMEMEVNLELGSEFQEIVLLVAVAPCPSQSGSGQGGSRERSLFPETEKPRRERPLYGN